ncbi:DUF5131 family protein [Pantoea sp. 18069]|uniref:DUF5131 family protein n=1 Tax=Pantoea sp. 18069 TaxID=2681415 RepID=UPI00190F2238|nr:DUF5131 family protein [Pantoea sp. 18069]
MSENSKIEWTDHTFNPWEGCQKVGPGCDHCYAETRNARFAGGTAVNWGPGAPRRRTSASNWEQADKAYQLHHINCAQCTAAGIVRSSQTRCPQGQALWDTYNNAGMPPHFAWLSQGKRTTR